MPRPDDRREPEPDPFAPEGGRDPEPPTVADMFAFLSEQVAEVAIAVRAGRSETAELRSEVMPHISRLNRKVFGSMPPPFPKPATSIAPGELLIASKPSTPPLVQRTTLTETGLETLSQEFASFREVVAKELGAQSRVMGLAEDDDTGGRGTARRVKRRQWLKDAIALMTLVVAAIGGVAALAAQRSAGTAAAAAVSASSVPVFQPAQKR